MSGCCGVQKQNRFSIDRFIRRIDKVYLLVAAIFILVAVLDYENLADMAAQTLGNLVHTAPYMIFAVVLVAWLKAARAERYVAAIFTGRERSMIVFAALLGGLAPLCSCEVIPVIAGLLAVGTPLPPIMAFWLSSPLIGPSSLLITAGVLGWKFALFKTATAVTLGLAGGFTVSVLMKFGMFGSPLKSFGSLSGCSRSAEKGVMWQFWREKSRIADFSAEMVSNGLFLIKWMLFAYTLESIMVNYIPADVIISVVGGEGIAPIAISALVGIPAYLNSILAPALVSGFMEQGMSGGSGMAFVVAGAVSSLPAMTAVFALVKKDVFAAYLILGILGAVTSGFIYSLI